MNRYLAADREVGSKSDRVIQRETAERYAARAIVCYRRHRRTGRVSWLLRAEDFRHEALEHAALVGDGGKLVGRVEERIKKERS